jgi:hypothetical protein
MPLFQLGENMKLKELIERLGREDADTVCRPGFGEADSYRGYYEQIAFEPKDSATVGEMLAHAKAANGKTFSGYKGGKYKMGDETIVNIAEYGHCGMESDELTHRLLDAMLVHCS